MKVIVAWVPGIIGILLFCASCAMKDPHHEIDKTMKDFYEKGSFNGAVLVAAKGTILYDTAMGYSDFSSGKKLDANNAFYLASLSKQFTAMGIMLLEHRHQLSYTDPVTKYIPELPAFARGITIQNLLHHTSGLADYLEVAGLVKPDFTNQQVLDWLKQQKSLAFHPGARFEYSNTGYVLLSLIIEKVSGKSFPVFMDEMIFTPLAMNNSKVYDTGKPVIEDRAIGFNRDKKKDDYNILTTGDGGIFSTTHDLFKWDQALYKEPLISQEALKAAFYPAKT